MPYLGLPAILHWEFNHFVVLERWTPRWAEIVDPAIGRRRVTMQEFDAAFTGVALSFEPGVQFERRDRAAQPAWRTFLRYMLNAPAIYGLIAQILLASLVLQLLGLAVPAFTQVFVDYVLPFQATDLMTIFALGAGIVILSQLVTSYLRVALLLYLQARLDTQLMLGFVEHLLSLPLRFFELRTRGDLMIRLGSNATIREMLTGQTLSMFLDGTLVIVYFSILLAQNPLFGASALALALVQVALLLVTTRRMHRLMQQDLAAQTQAQSYVVEILSGIATLKATGAEDRAMDHWSNLFFRQTNVALRRQHLAALIDTALAALRICAPLILLWVGATQVLAGAMTLGAMLGLSALAAIALAPLATLVSSGQQLQFIGAHLERIVDVLNAPAEQDAHAAPVAPLLTGRIELDNVSFRYDANAPLILKNITCAIEPGQKVALVGRSGSGKSTLAKLLLGLYAPTEGDIRYDGTPLQRLNYRSVRRQFGVVMQDAPLFNGSIRQNISFNEPSLSIEEVMRAAQLAAVDDEIRQMPMGYETIIAEGGSSLSGGQRQRLAIARALAHQPPLLILDEATSHLDVTTERLVDQHISALACTRIVIAHRLSTVRNADMILVLDNGVIVERGAHDELLNRNGFYAALIQGQETPQSQDTTA
jgi:ABC-type bacteriocin/lantibiotic exporter with double-glycine peptidase domain